MVKRLLDLVALLLTCGLGAAQAEGPRMHTQPSLVAEFEQSDGVTPFWVLFQLEIERGWHTYWKNPGDSGLAPTLRWTLPEGTTASDIVWQPPERQPIPPLLNYGYSGASYHLVKITPGPKLPASNGMMRLALLAKWLVCEEGCVPEQSSLALEIPIGSTNRPASSHALIQKLVASASLKPLALTKLSHDQTTLRLEAPLLAADEGYFFPDVGGVIEPAAPQRFTVTQGRVELELRRGLVPVPAPLTGLLEVRVGEQRTYYAARSGLSLIAESDRMGMVFIVLSAFLGGIILNAMPCVFPILSLKALAVSRKAAQNPKESRSEAIAYTLGVISSFLLLGGVLVAVRAGGAAIGWGYQMQSPVFVTGLIYLLFIIGLNLSGMFEITIAFGGGGRFTNRDSLLGSFATGVLATAVATPCTAPFMATALGAALTLPTWGALLVFLALGFGLAAPFLIIAWFPFLLGWLPKPGVWMERLKELLAFPMYLATAWLLWVVGQQVGPDQQLLIVVGLIGVVFGIWVWPLVRRLRVLWLFALLAAAFFPFASLSLPPPALEPTGRSIDAIGELRQAGKPVFAYATAAWCITCKVNERLVLDTAEAQALFRAHGVEVIRADWTNANPAITSWLASFERNGVPLYVYYPSAGEPRVLPQLLSMNVLREMFEQKQ